MKGRKEDDVMMGGFALPNNVNYGSRM